MQSRTSLECESASRQLALRLLLTGLTCTGTERSFCKPTICNHSNGVLLGSKAAVVIRGIFFFFYLGLVKYFLMLNILKKKKKKREITFRYSLNDLVTNLYEKPYTG